MESRAEGEIRVFWVDALSINQIDDEEKSQQVRQMKAIYQSASRTVIWLGREQDGSDLAMNLVAKLGVADPETYEVDDSSETLKAWDALSRLFERYWWSRAWILQETAVAMTDPWVGCGNLWLSWAAFEKVHALVVSQASHAEEASLLILGIARSSVSAIHLIRNHIMNGSSPMTIEHLLKISMTFNATDPRDKVYALLGLTTDTSQAALRVDYTDPVRDVYTRLAGYIIPFDINMICFNINSQEYDLPSWVPDWSWSSQRWPLWTANTYHTSGDRKPLISFSNDGNTLHVSGIIVDNIKIIDNSVPSGPNQGTNIISIVESMEFTLRKAIVEEIVPDTLDPEHSESFWRTLVADQSMIFGSHSGSRTPAPRAYARMFSVVRHRSPVPEDFLPNLRSPARKEQFVQPFRLSLLQTLEGQRFFITNKGLIGIGPGNLRASDVIVIILGADMPFVLRQRGNGFHQLIGVCYVHGIMNGEALRSGTRDSFDSATMTFNLS